MKSRTSRPGVTLVEMLVVMAILMMLAGLVAVVWRSLDAQTQERKLRNTLTILDNALTEYQDARGRFPVPDANAVTVEARNEFMCRTLLEEPQSRVIMDRLDGGPRGALRRVKPPGPTLVYDPWDRPLDYTYTTGDTFFLLRSAGPDQTYQTRDDITYR
jgi:prepilin-type N-terminal cleavage/methylation domain-containing protein